MIRKLGRRKEGEEIERQIVGGENCRMWIWNDQKHKKKGRKTLHLMKVLSRRYPSLSTKNSEQGNVQCSCCVSYIFTSKSFFPCLTLTESGRGHAMKKKRKKGFNHKNIGKKDGGTSNRGSQILKKSDSKI